MIRRAVGHVRQAVEARATNLEELAVCGDIKVIRPQHFCRRKVDATVPLRHLLPCSLYESQSRPFTTLMDKITVMAHYFDGAGNYITTKYHAARRFNTRSLYKYVTFPHGACPLLGNKARKLGTTRTRRQSRRGNASKKDSSRCMLPPLMIQTLSSCKPSPSC